MKIRFSGAMTALYERRPIVFRPHEPCWCDYLYSNLCCGDSDMYGNLPLLLFSPRIIVSRLNSSRLLVAMMRGVRSQDTREHGPQSSTALIQTKVGANHIVKVEFSNCSALLTKNAAPFAGKARNIAKLFLYSMLMRNYNVIACTKQ